MGQVKVFLDTDVVISALLSKTGVSYETIENSKVKKTISKIVKKEVEEVAKKLDIDPQNVKKVLNKIDIISLKLTKEKLLRNYKKYVLDDKDSHVVAGVNISKSKFLLTHNVRNYKIDKINADFGIIVLKPGNFLQYLRSVDKF